MSPELALYALDVYYNQTYLGAGGQGFAYGYNEKKDDLEPGLYPEFQLYYDPFQTTYRAINNWDFNMSKVRSYSPWKVGIGLSWLTQPTRSRT